jgi:16S rRNA (adenine1518-N6/adenine1519-N6)-dimethyltransferase
VKRCRPDPIPVRKSLGQNFLQDPNIIKKIINSCRLAEDDIVLEIGPGYGALTRHIAPKVGKLILVEKDRMLIPHLAENWGGDNVTIRNEDFLKTDWTRLPGNLKIIGNLPYNISTPIIESVIAHRGQCRSFHFMVQREHAQRLTGVPGIRNYSSLTCFVNYYADVWRVLSIPPQAFRPSPRVHSWFMEMRFKDPSGLKARNEARLFELIKSSFQQRRKMIQNSFQIIPADVRGELIRKAGLDPKARPENITLDGYVAISNLWLEMEEAGQIQ